MAQNHRYLPYTIPHRGSRQEETVDMTSPSAVGSPPVSVAGFTDLSLGGSDGEWQDITTRNTTDTTEDLNTSAAAAAATTPTRYMVILSGLETSKLNHLASVIASWLNCSYHDCQKDGKSADERTNWMKEYGDGRDTLSSMEERAQMYRRELVAKMVERGCFNYQDDMRKAHVVVTLPPTKPWYANVMRDLRGDGCMKTVIVNVRHGKGKLMESGWWNVWQSETGDAPVLIDADNTMDDQTRLAWEALEDEAVLQLRS